MDISRHFEDCCLVGVEKWGPSSPRSVEWDQLSNLERKVSAGEVSCLPGWGFGGWGELLTRVRFRRVRWAAYTRVRFRRVRWASYQGEVSAGEVSCLYQGEVSAGEVSFLPGWGFGGWGGLLTKVRFRRVRRAAYQGWIVRRDRRAPRRWMWLQIGCWRRTVRWGFPWHSSGSPQPSAASSRWPGSRTCCIGPIGNCIPGWPSRPRWKRGTGRPWWSPNHCSLRKQWSKWTTTASSRINNNFGIFI